MARSIHTTRRDLENLARWDVSDVDTGARESERLSSEFEHKRDIKAAASERSADRPDGATPPDAIPIHVRDEGPYVHYPASETDLRAVIARLPAGVLDGVHSITLSLGKLEQEHRDADAECPLDRDPYTERKGWESLPGVYLPDALGTYTAADARIAIYAYVYDPDLPDREMWEVYLRLKMLATLVHEIAHHFDHTLRTGRNRWLADDEHKVEFYAEHWEYARVRDAVVPYLEENYSKQLAQLRAWIRHYGGASITAERLAGDPRLRAKGGCVNVENFFGFQSALYDLATAVKSSVDLRTTRMEFARQLHYAGYYDEALESIASVLQEHPGDAEAMVLQADIAVHLERYGEAEVLARQVTEKLPDDLDVWKVLADALEGLEQWRDLLATVERVMALREWPEWSDGLQKARALVELGEIERAEEAISELEARETAAYIRRHTDWLRKHLAKRRTNSSARSI